MATDAARDAAVGALPDDLLLHIFQRLADPVDLLRCIGTCKRWLRAVTADDAAFLRRSGVRRENKKATILLGAFCKCQKDNNGVVPRPSDTAKIPSDCTPRCWRLHGAAVGRPGFGFFSILPKHDGLFNFANPLASRGGLLLMCLVPAPLDYRKLHLAVCHPLLGGVHRIPPPLMHLHPPLATDLTGYALITGYGGECMDSHRHRQLAFRVLFTAIRRDNGVVYAYSYSSATGIWSAPTMCPRRLRNLTMSGPRAGVVDGRGTTHWLYRDALHFYTLDVSADAARISLTKIPILVEDKEDRQLMQLHPPFPFITQGGKLSLVFVRQPYGNMLQFWTKQDQDGNNQGWIHKEQPMFHPPVEPFISLPFISFKIIGFAESKGALLVKCYYGLLFLDLETRVLELIKGSEYSTYPREDCLCSMGQGYNSCNECAYNNCVLYEMDWSSYLLHLSAWSPRGVTW